MLCKICDGQMDRIFKKTILKKYQVWYWHCRSCEFIQTDFPYWLEEAYSSAITSLDIGMLDRNLYYSNIISKLIDDYLGYDADERFLDFAGGYGVFVRLMRDRGYNFFRHDIYCENLFAQNFDVGNELASMRYTMVTAIEVVEHLIDPLKEISLLTKTTDEFIFSTELQPRGGDLELWWYLAPEIGQHISFFTKKTLDIMAEKLDRYCVSFGNLHWFSKIPRDLVEFNQRVDAYRNPPKKRCSRKIKERLFGEKANKKAYRVERKSLLEFDFELAKGKLFK